MLNLIRELGTMNGHSDVEIVEVETEGIIALTKWNGEQYNECYHADELGYSLDANERYFYMKPEYKQVGEDEYEIIGYDMYY